MEIRTGCAGKQIFVDFLTDSWSFKLLFDNDGLSYWCHCVINVMILSDERESSELRAAIVSYK